MTSSMNVSQVMTITITPKSGVDGGALLPGFVPIWSLSDPTAGGLVPAVDGMSAVFTPIRTGVSVSVSVSGQNSNNMNFVSTMEIFVNYAPANKFEFAVSVV